MLTVVDTIKTFNDMTLRFDSIDYVLDSNGDVIGVNAVFQNCNKTYTFSLSEKALEEDGYEDDRDEWEEIPNEFEVDDQEEFDSDR